MNRLAGIIAAACLLASGGQTDVWAQGGKTPTYPVVPLSVFVEAGDSWKITGDGFAYENGSSDGTTANIDKYGNLIISFGRAVMFDYSAPLPGPGTLSSGAHDNSYISTLGQLRGTPTPLQNLGSSGGSQCIRLNWQYDVSGGMRRHGFNRGPGPDQWAQDETSYAVVTRTGDTWVVEPASADFDCAGYSNPPDSPALVFSQVSSKGKWVTTSYGHYSLPFRLTLTRQP